MMKYFVVLMVASTSLLVSNFPAEPVSVHSSNGCGFEPVDLNVSDKTPSHKVSPADNCLEVSEILRGYDITTKYDVMASTPTKHNCGRVPQLSDLSSKEKQQGKIDDARFVDATKEKSMFARFTGWVAKQFTSFCNWIQSFKR